MKKYYITTPIYYVNDVPHIGHTCTTLVADFLARYHRLNNRQVFFLTGTDEHGLKVAQAAAKKNLSPQKFCDQVSTRFQKIWKKLNISHDYFVRTTDLKHKKIASQIIQKIYDKGDIYQDTYEGLYCIGCEKFLTETDLVNDRCPLHPPEKTIHQKEENWFFKLSKYVPQIIKLIENDKTNYVFPAGKRKEVLAKLKAGVHDISFSRASVDWGIPVPWDNSQTIYVWIEALLNYYTASQFLPNKIKFWPADLLLVGKEISWFHLVIWQAMLFSIELPLPKKVFVHDFYIIDGKKISKSQGNKITPQELVKKFGVEGTRYLIGSSFPANNDTNASIARFTEKYNADLANGLGNLVSRVLSLVEKYCAGKIPKITKDPDSHPLRINKKIHNWKRAWQDIDHFLPLCQPSEALESVWKFISEADKYINQNKPWELAKKDKKKFNWVIYGLLDSLHQIAWQIYPFLPETATKIAKQLDIKKLLVKNPQNKDGWTNLKPGTKIKLGKPLFPRITPKT